MQIIQNRKVYFTISGVFVGASLIALIIFGLKPGIDFTGGSLLEIEIKKDLVVDSGQIIDLLSKDEKPLLPAVAVQSSGERGFILRFKDVTEEEHQEILKTLRLGVAPKSEGEQGQEDSEPGININATNEQGQPVDIRSEVVAESGTTTIGEEEAVSESSFETIGPTVGQELKRKAIYAVIAVLAAIIIFIAWAFRKVSKPVSSWKYGVTAILALVHDVTIPVGVFAVLGKFYGVEVDILFVTALLTILGYSVNDTIIVFDRTRENLSRHIGANFEETVNQSVNETIGRSIYTSATVLLVLLAIFFFGGESVHYFSLALIIGVVFGTYSSIFLASPLLVEWERWTRRRS